MNLYWVEGTFQQPFQKQRQPQSASGGLVYGKAICQRYIELRPEWDALAENDFYERPKDSY